MIFMKKGILLLLVVSMLASIVIGCGNQGVKEDMDKIKEKIKDVVGQEKEEVDDETAIEEVVLNYLKALNDGVTYENITGMEGYEYLTSQYRQQLIDTDDSAEWVDWVKEDKVVLRLGEVMLHRITIADEHPDIAGASVSYEIYYKAQEEEEEMYIYNCAMVLLKVDGIWQIHDITYVYDDEEAEE